MLAPRLAFVKLLQAPRGNQFNLKVSIVGLSLQPQLIMLIFPLMILDIMKKPPVDLMKVHCNTIYILGHKCLQLWKRIWNTSSVTVSLVHGNEYETVKYNNQIKSN